MKWAEKGKSLVLKLVRNLIITSYKVNKNVSNLSRTLGIPRSTVKSIIKKFKRHNDVKKIVLEEAGSHYLRRETLRNFLGSLKKIEGELSKI